MALQSFNTSCDRKFRKKRNPHTRSQQLCLAESQEDVPRLPSAPEAWRATRGLALLGRAFSSSGVFPWVAARKAPEFIKNPKPRAQLVVFTTRLWIPPSRRGASLAGAALHGTHPAGTPDKPCSEPEGKRRCRGGKRQRPPGTARGKAPMHRALPAARPGLLWDPRGQAPRGQGCAAGRTGLGGSSCGKSGLSTLHINAPRALIAVGPIAWSH